MHARSLLFVPGNRPDRFDKAVNTGADLVVIDLEDAVGPDDKDKAREEAITYLLVNKHPNVGLRINAQGTKEYERDIKALRGSKPDLPFVMLPKVDHLSDMQSLSDAVPKECGAIAPVMESGAAMINAGHIFSHPRLKLALFGGVDYSADIGSTLSWEALHYARSHLAAAAAMCDVHVFDVPYLDVRDPQGCYEETKRVKALGIPARAAIHPSQIEPIHRAYTPSAAEIDYAHKVIKAYEQSKGGVALLDGKLIEAPIIKTAQRILANQS